MPKFRHLPAAVLVALGLAAAPAAAQDLSDTCRASAARVALTQPVELNLEPVRANAIGTPCSDQSASTVQRTTIGPITAEAAAAFTDAGDATGAGALASIADADVDLSGLVINVDAVQATALAGCDGTTPTLAGTSRVVGLTINGNAITIPPGDEFFEIDASPLVRVALNVEIVENGVLTRRAVEINTPLGDVVLAEAIAGQGADACRSEVRGDTGSGGGGGGGAPRPCPQGAEYDAQNNVCVIRDEDKDGDADGDGQGDAPPYQGATAGDVVTGRPFEGPSGGSLVTLDQARALHNSRCLQGDGPDYAIVGTKGSDRITGTNEQDRILLLGGRDSSEGGRGDDCIDGAGGVDTMSGALGADRLIGRGGGDHLIGGSSADRLISGKGADTINAGFGADVIKSGRGRDRINVATAGPAARVNCGKGFDKLRHNSNEARRTRKCERRYMLR